MENRREMPTLTKYSSSCASGRSPRHQTPPPSLKEALIELRGDLLTFVETPEALEWHQSVTARK